VNEDRTVPIPDDVTEGSERAPSYPKQNLPEVTQQPTKEIEPDQPHREVEPDQPPKEIEPQQTPKEIEPDSAVDRTASQPQAIVDVLPSPAIAGPQETVNAARLNDRPADPTAATALVPVPAPEPAPVSVSQPETAPATEPETAPASQPEAAPATEPAPGTAGQPAADTRMSQAPPPPGQRPAPPPPLPGQRPAPPPAGADQPPTSPPAPPPAQAATPAEGAQPADTAQTQPVPAPTSAAPAASQAPAPAASQAPSATLVEGKRPLAASKQSLYTAHAHTAQPQPRHHLLGWLFHDDDDVHLPMPSSQLPAAAFPTTYMSPQSAAATGHGNPPACTPVEKAPKKPCFLKVWIHDLKSGHGSDHDGCGHGGACASAQGNVAPCETTKCPKKPCFLKVWIHDWKNGGHCSHDSGCGNCGVTASPQGRANCEPAASAPKKPCFLKVWIHDWKNSHSAGCGNCQNCPCCGKGGSPVAGSSQAGIVPGQPTGQVYTRP
jgi:hypothetical protein